MNWLDTQQLQIDPPKRPKKITGTRFASILGLNPWATEFEMWCEITKTYQKPFEDTIYTIAGKVIEPKQAEYMRQFYGMNIVTPTDEFGENYFKKTYGDFFKENPHLGGMWDYKVRDNGKIVRVLEMKTTKRVEDWGDDIPEYYALQAALYAWLLGVDDVTMVASFLEDADYQHPAAFVPSYKNTITRSFKVSERYPDFAQKVQQVEDWWEKYVDTGISPVYNEKRDAEILKALRTNSLSPDTEIDELVREAEQLKIKLDKAKAEIDADSKRYDQLCKLIKDYAVGQFREGDNKVEIKGQSMTWCVSKTKTTSVDKKALEKDGLLEKYLTTSEQYRITVK